MVAMLATATAAAVIPFRACDRRDGCHKALVSPCGASGAATHLRRRACCLLPLSDLFHRSDLSQEAKEDAEKTPLQFKLDEFGDTLTWIIGVICVAVSRGRGQWQFSLLGQSAVPRGGGAERGWGWVML